MQGCLPVEVLPEAQAAAGSTTIPPSRQLTLLLSDLPNKHVSLQLPGHAPPLLLAPTSLP